MSNKTNSVTLSRVTAEIEEILEDYPKQPYQIAFSIPELRQKLIERVSNKMPSCYSSSQSVRESQEPSGSLHCSLEERVLMVTLIRGSIFQILRENAELVSRHLHQNKSHPSQPQHAVDQPSHWFG